MDSDSMVGMVGRLGRMDKSGKMGTGNVGVGVVVVFFDVSHNCHNRIHSHHHRLCHIDYNQIGSLLFPPFDFSLGYAMEGLTVWTFA
ncbi:hypothetical protein JSQ81_09425 [Sporosarcina sp. Marseille-Q4063]|uniref:hypothetical protein n=1 Tax=Sporosarcina sp. Marseille-Q4063 TaxID=2810514 RepID=UPI001BAE98A9|nr:hypothetical protein [Sporosarcina sp. Marseille-Q4063]QUW23694.1 hypothetical protein JSQ81_09425 [Sporosarcina sp. Marseille-Q4063]